MTPEEQLLDVLRRSAEGVVADPDDAFDQVLTRKHRADQRRRLLIVAAAFVLVAGAGISFLLRTAVDLGSSVGPAQGGGTTTAPNTFSAGSGAGLTGEGQTTVIPADHVRASLAVAGIDCAVADRLLGGAQRWVVQLTFSGSLVVETWDPAKPATSLRMSHQFAYRTLPHNRLALTSTDGSSRWSFTFHVSSGGELLLHYQGTSGRPSADTARWIAWTSTPAILVR